ncbi:MAG: sodium:glutamate symporter [Clostridia bacterium]|nr:sodium:glutamate symporter [Clostridia bacterium]
MDYSAANSSLWKFVIELGLIAAAILAAHYLHWRIKRLQKAMLPVAVLAGFLLLGAKYLGLPLDEELLEMLVFHGIALGFIAMSLRVPPKAENGNGNLTGFKSGAIIVSTYLVQGVLGLMISLLLSYTLMPGLFRAAGLLLPMGYGQGPGQANNVGSTYEALGFAGGRSFGMSIAAAGYLVACTVGVVIINVLKRRNKLTLPQQVSPAQSAQDYFDSDSRAGLSASLDVLSLQAALVLVVYLVTFLVTWGLTSLIAAAPNVAKTVSPLLWGFNFIIGSALAIGLRALLAKRKEEAKRVLRYQNNYMLNRISGFFFDIMIVAGIASINLEDIRGLWLPFLLMALLGGAATWVHLSVLCKKVYKGYYYQGLVSMFGMLTGTISSGVLLLREIDPELSTPAANNLITGSSFGIVLGAPILVLVSLAARSELLCWVTLGIALAYLGFLCFLIFRFQGKKAAK